MKQQYLVYSKENCSDSSPMRNFHGVFDSLESANAEKELSIRLFKRNGRESDFDRREVTDELTRVINKNNPENIYRVYVKLVCPNPGVGMLIL